MRQIFKTRGYPDSIVNTDRHRSQKIDRQSTLRFQFSMTIVHVTTQENRSILLCLCLCLRRCVVRVNRDDASISTSASTRRLCLRRTGLHVGFLCLCLCLCLCLRRTCKPGFKNKGDDSGC